MNILGSVENALLSSQTHANTSWAFQFPLSSVVMRSLQKQIRRDQRANTWTNRHLSFSVGLQFLEMFRSSEVREHIRAGMEAQNICLLMRHFDSALLPFTLRGQTSALSALS